jgi:hypothetical protein
MNLGLLMSKVPICSLSQQNVILQNVVPKVRQFRSAKKIGKFFFLHFKICQVFAEAALLNNENGFLNIDFLAAACLASMEGRRRAFAYLKSRTSPTL